MIALPVYILAGGHSRRFGSDKARALLHTKPLLLHAAQALAPVASRLHVVARDANQYADLGIAGVADSTAHRGPLGGLEAALRHRGEGWLLLAACDVVGVQPAWIQELAQHGARSHGEPDPAPAVAFRDEARWQPLPSLWHTAALARVQAALALAMTAPGQGALWRLLDTVAATAVALPHGWGDLVAINTPADLAWAAAASLRAHEPA